MDVYIPLILYAVVVTNTSLILLRKNGVIRHFPIFLFLLFQLPGVLNIATTDIFHWDLVHFSYRNYLSEDEFLLALCLFYFEIFLCVIFYCFFSKRKSARVIRKQWFKDLVWQSFSIRWQKAIKTKSILVAAICVCIGLYIRYGVYGYDTFIAPVKAVSVEDIRQASYGKSQALEALFISVAAYVFFIFLEYGYKFRAFLILLYLLSGSILSGSKAGLLVWFFNIFVYLVVRKKMKLSVRHIVILVLLAFPSLIIGDTFRNYYRSGGGDVWAHFEPWGWVSGIAKRDTSLGSTLVMLVKPSFYSHIIPEYQASVFLLAIPSFIWPDKPISPGYAIARLLGLSTQSAAPGWLGGFMFLFGPFALFFGPLIVGYVLGLFSRHFANSEIRPSLKFPILFYLLMKFLTMVMDGAYHSFIAEVVIVLVVLSLYYGGLLILNGRMGIPPIFRRRLRF